MTEVRTGENMGADLFYAVCLCGGVARTAEQQWSTYVPACILARCLVPYAREQLAQACSL